jgi:hypothetical protein
VSVARRLPAGVITWAHHAFLEAGTAAALMAVLIASVTVCAASCRSMWPAAGAQMCVACGMPR